MSKIDSGPRPQPDIHEGKVRVRDQDVAPSPEDFGKAYLAMLKREQVHGSKLLTLEISRATAQLREVMADEYLKILQAIPGYVAPPMSRPPSADDVRGLLKTLLQFDQQGLLKDFDAFKQAQNPDAARGSLLENDSSPLGKQWSQFVQAPTNAQTPRPGEKLSLDGASEGKSPGQLLSQELTNQAEGPSLRTPQLAGEPFKAFTNKQKLDLMTAAFGLETAMALKELGVRDPITLLKQAATPEARAHLSRTLGLSRGELIVHLARAELLQIGPGRGGEQALRPQHLPALAEGGILTLSQLASVKLLSAEQLANLYKTVRENFSGFARAMSGERPILKKDLHHWAKTACRKKSQILDADWDELPKRNGDAEELIMAWYLEHFSELEDKRAGKPGRTEASLAGREDATATPGLEPPKVLYDPVRDDGLICFWIERPNFNPGRPALLERVYVCLDPRTGMIDLKSIE